MERKVLKLSTNWELDALGRHGKVGTQVVKKLFALRKKKNNLWIQCVE